MKILNLLVSIFIITICSVICDSNLKKEYNITTGITIQNQTSIDKTQEKKEEISKGLNVK